MHAPLHLLLALPLALPLDIAPNPIRRSGETPAPRAATAVAMDSETVTLTLHEDHAVVRAVFTMRNTSARPETLEVGFPSAAEPESYTISREGIDVKRWGPAQIQAFAAEVDGQAVTAEVKGEVRGKDAFGWLCWPMDFEGGETRTVEVRYRVPTRDDNYAPPSALRNRQLTYILKTGAGWKGPIGSATVILDLAGFSPAHVTDMAPEPTARTAQAWTWERKDFEPDADVVVQYRVYADAKDAVAKLEPLVKSQPDDVGALFDYAENLEAERQLEAAAGVFARLHELEAKTGDPVRRARLPYVPPAFRAMQCFRAAGSREQAREWASRAEARLREAIGQIEGRDVWRRKQYRTSAQALTKLLEECRVPAVESPASGTR